VFLEGGVAPVFLEGGVAPVFLEGAVAPVPWHHGTMASPSLPRRVAKFRENRPRDVENLVDGKNK